MGKDRTGKNGDPKAKVITFRLGDTWVCLPHPLHLCETGEGFLLHVCLLPCHLRDLKPLVAPLQMSKMLICFLLLKELHLHIQVQSDTIKCQIALGWLLKRKLILRTQARISGAATIYEYGMWRNSGLHLRNSGDGWGSDLCGVTLRQLILDRGRGFLGNRISCLKPPQSQI